MKNLLLATLLLTTPALANETAITIYSKAEPGSVDPSLYRPALDQGQGYSYYTSIPGYAVVRHVRNVKLPYKNNILRFADVAALLDPTTVQFKSLTDPKNTKVAEQNYQFDLVSQQKLMEKFIDKEIVVERTTGQTIETIKGTLLSTNGGITLKDEKGGITALQSTDRINFPQLPDGLITKPTLVWEILASKLGEHKTEVSYQTDGITWWADYNLTFNEGKDANSGTLDLGSWVSIVNKSGATYKNAKLKLMAGDVQRAQAPRPAAPRMMKADMMYGEAAAAPVFEEKSFFEYHLYTLSRPATIPDNSTKQLELIPQSANIPAEKIMVYNGAEGYNYYPGSIQTGKDFGQTSNKKVAVYLKFKNAKENGLGVPLPAGRVRVNQRDSDGSLEFIGENVIGHTARNEELLLKLGEAFDVVGERKQTNFTVDSNRKTIDEEITIKVRNQKSVPVKVRIAENLYRATNWEITDSSDDFVKDDSNNIHFDVSVGAEKEKEVTYKIRYTW